MKVVCIVNQKGGCGKTTTASNLATALGKFDKKVLVIDSDPQGNCTDALGLDCRNLEHTLADIIPEIRVSQEQILQCINKTKYANIYVIPANKNLAEVAVELTSKTAPDLRLKKIVEQIKALFDYIIIDSPPNLGVLLKNALAASTDMIIPISDYYSVSGLVDLLETIDDIKYSYNIEINILGVLLTKYDKRIVLTQEISDALEKHFKDKVFKTNIRVNKQLEYAQKAHTPVIHFNDKCNGYEDYTNLAKEILQYGK